MFQDSGRLKAIPEPEMPPETAKSNELSEKYELSRGRVTRLFGGAAKTPHEFPVFFQSGGINDEARLTPRVELSTLLARRAAVAFS